VERQGHPAPLGSVDRHPTEREESVAARVIQLWRYRAKSMMGERLDVAAVTARGVLGDRGWAVRDEVRGGIRGAKKIGGLTQLGAQYLEEPALAARQRQAVLTPGSRSVSRRAGPSDISGFPVVCWTS